MGDPAAGTSGEVFGQKAPEEVENKRVAQFLRQQAELFQRLDRVADKPIRVRRWDIEGLERTRLPVIEKELAILAEARTFGELREILQDLYISLENLAIFSAINVTADEATQGSAAVEACDVQIKVVEKNRVGVQLGCFLQGSQGSLDTKVNLTNTLGLAETIQLKYEIGKEPTSLLEIFSRHQMTSEFAVKLMRPRLNAQPVNGSLTLHQLGRDNLRWSSYHEQLTGGIGSLSSEDGAHTASYELGWRQIMDPSRRASPAVQQQLGHSLKSAVSYTWRHNTFNDPFFPTAGFGIRSQTELAGLWVDPRALRFGKQEIQGQVFWKLAEGVAVSLSSGGGILLPWGPDFWRRPSPISERFSVGGVSANMRGFYFKGLGQTALRRRPHDTTAQNGSEDEAPERQRSFDYLGGDLYLSVLASLRFQLPWVKPLHGAGIFGHVFCNGANNVLLSGQHKQPRELLRDFRDTFRWTAGVGLVWPISMGSFELNYVRILRSQQRDEWRHGIHFGCSADWF